MYIPKRFFDEVYFHLAVNYRSSVDAGCALILGIHGPAGEGKTQMTRHILEDAGVETQLISGGQLESGTAGEPAEIIRTAYLQAGTLIANGVPAAVLLNDADAAIGSWGSLTQYTVNTQNVVTELMHLADYPRRVEGRTTARVPIFMTGNDFTRLYGPLRRPGRMNLFRWELADDERAEIVRVLLCHLKQDQVDRLLARYPGHSVAFWSAINARAERDLFLRSVAHHSIKEIVHHLAMGGEVRFEKPSQDDLLTLIEEAAEHVVNNTATSFLNDLQTLDQETLSGGHPNEDSNEDIYQSGPDQTSGRHSSDESGDSRVDHRDDSPRDSGEVDLSDNPVRAR